MFLNGEIEECCYVTSARLDDPPLFSWLIKSIIGKAGEAIIFKFKLGMSSPLSALSFSS